MHHKISLLGVPISLVNQANIMSLVQDLLLRKPQVFIATPNPEHIMLAQNDKSFMGVLQHTDLNIPDGIGIVWAIKRKLKIENKKLEIERVAGIDLMYKLCLYASKHQIRIGLLGGVDGVAKKATQNLIKQFPSIDIITLPYYEYGQKDNKIVQEINDSKIQMLFVALGAPKQELFISKYLQSMSTVQIAMGVGGAFDVFAGKLKRPPLWVQNLGLEWLFRLLQEPWRCKRQINLLKFVSKVLLESKA